MAKLRVWWLVVLPEVSLEVQRLIHDPLDVREVYRTTPLLLDECERLCHLQHVEDLAPVQISVLYIVQPARQVFLGPGLGGVETADEDLADLLALLRAQCVELDGQRY